MFDWLENISAPIKRNNLIDSIQYAKNKLDEITIPAYTQVKEGLTEVKTKGKMFVKLMEVYASITSHVQDARWFEDFGIRLNHMRQNLNLVEKEAQRQFESTTYTDAISMSKSQLIACVYSMEHVATETCFIMECMLRDAMPGNTLSKHDHEKCIETAKNVFSILRDMGEEFNKFRKNLEALPDLILTKDNYSHLMATIDHEKAPFHHSNASGFMPNLTLWAVDLVADYKLWRYNRDKLIKKQLEQRILFLQAKQDGQNTAAIEKQIAYYDKEVSKLQDKIEAFEEKYA